MRGEDVGKPDRLAGPKCGQQTYRRFWQGSKVVSLDQRIGDRSFSWKRKSSGDGQLGRNPCGTGLGGLEVSGELDGAGTAPSTALVSVFVCLSVSVSVSVLRSRSLSRSASRCKAQLNEAEAGVVGTALGCMSEVRGCACSIADNRVFHLTVIDMHDVARQLMRDDQGESPKRSRGEVRAANRQAEAGRPRVGVLVGGRVEAMNQHAGPRYWGSLSLSVCVPLSLSRPFTGRSQTDGIQQPETAGRV